MNGWEKEIEEKIDELKKKKANLDYTENIGRRLSELEKKIGKFDIGDFYNLQTMVNILDWNKEIAELKERVEGLYKSIHGIAPDQADVNTEVLREHLKGHLRVYELIDSVEKPVDVEWKKHLEGQLAKFDGKTEDGTYMFLNSPDMKIETEKKDSKMEKKEIVYHKWGGKVISKPLYPDPNTIEVKREDLQFLIGYLEGWHTIYIEAIDIGEKEGLERIKEEYNIE